MVLIIFFIGNYLSGNFNWFAIVGMFLLMSDMTDSKEIELIKIV